MKKTQAFEARTQRSMPLDAVARSEEVVIACLSRAQEAAERIRARAATLQAAPFDRDEWKELRDDGRA